MIEISKWPLVELNMLMKAPLLNGKHERGMLFGDGNPIVRMVDLYKYDIIDSGLLDRVRYPSPTPTDYLLTEGDILINRTSLKREGIAKASLVSKLLERTYFDCSIIRVRPDKERVYPKYLLYALNGPIVRPQIMKYAKTATITTISQPGINRLRIPLPSYTEQKRIVNILETCESAIQKRKEANRLTDEFLKSTFLEMFGGPVKNTKRWQLNKLSEVGSLDRGKSEHRPRNAPELLGGPYPLIQTGDIANSDVYITDYHQTYSELGLKQSRMWNAKTLCITIAANIAKTGILTFDACFPDSVVGFISNKKIETEYVHFWFTFWQTILEEKAPKSAQRNINLRILRNLNIPVPPIELQQKFVDIVQKVEKLKQKQSESEKELNTLFKSLMQKAFRGEL